MWNIIFWIFAIIGMITVFVFLIFGIAVIFGSGSSVSSSSRIHDKFDGLGINMHYES